MIISIDGPAGSGKSTIAKILAKQIGFVHFNSGSLYRAIAVWCVKNNLNINTYSFSDITLNVKYIKDVQHVYVNGFDTTPYLRDNNISNIAPTVSKIKKVRELVDNCQKSYASNHNVIIDGRDIGSYVFPNANYKFYLDCDVRIRAKRRFNEEQQKNSNITFEEILNQIIERDNIDKNKKIAPLIVPDGAIIIDSSYKDINQVVHEMISHLKI